MRSIKLCSPQLGMSPISSLGGEIYDYQTLKGFAKRGFKVLIYLPKKRFYGKKVKNFCITYSFITHIFPPWLFSFICLPYLFRTYHKERFDVLRIHSPGFLGITAAVFHFFYPKVPVLASAVTVDSSRIYYLIEKYVFKISSKIIVQSEYMKKLLIKKYHISQAKIAVTYGGYLDGPKKWDNQPKESEFIKDNDRVLLFMGALIRRKNPLFALDIFIKVHSKLQNVVLVVIGKGSLKKKMQDKIEEKKLASNVVFIKSAYGGEKAYWFSRMDIFIFPSLNEGFGLVVTEAMSFGKVVMTSDKTAFKEIIENGTDGFLLPLNKNLWRETILKVLKNGKLADKIGYNSLNKAKNKFSWEITYDLNKKVVEQLI